MNKSVVAAIVRDTVPISLLNKGQANKIIEAVRRNGPKVIIKNNEPICVMSSIDDYLRMEELLEDYRLLLEAEQRIIAADGKPTLTHHDIMTRYKLTDADLDEHVEIE